MQKVAKRSKPPQKVKLTKLTIKKVEKLIEDDILKQIKGGAIKRTAGSVFMDCHGRYG